MMKHHQQLATSEVLRAVVDNHPADDIRFFELKAALQERGFGLLMVIFILPLAIPVPYVPGLTTVLVIPVWIFSAQMVIGMDSPWLPSWLANKSIPRTTLAAVLDKAIPKLKKVERLLHPRLLFASSRTGEKVIGVFAFLMCVSIAIPLPLTNLVPAWGILVMALGLLSKDGATIILGMVVGSVGLAIATGVVLFGAKAVLTIFPWLASIG